MKTGRPCNARGQLDANDRDLILWRHFDVHNCTGFEEVIAPLPTLQKGGGGTCVYERRMENEAPCSLNT